MGAKPVTAPLLSVRGLTCMRGEARILEDLSFSLERGEILALLAANGGGKSTLIKTLAGLHAPTRGEIVLEGHPLPPDPVRSGAMGVVLETPADQFVAETVQDEIDFARSTCRDSPPSSWNALLESFGLHGVLDRSPLTLSGGEQARLLVALAVIRRPRVLLLDDPFVFLGWSELTRLWECLRSLIRERMVEACIFSTTETELALWGTRVAVLHEAGLWFKEPPEALFTNSLPPGIQRPLALRCADALDGEQVLIRGPITLHTLARKVAEHLA